MRPGSQASSGTETPLTFTTMNAISSSDVPPAALATAQLRHWWVNHLHSDRAEVDGSYLWLPKKNGNGSTTQSQRNMGRIGPGDIVFSCAQGAIAAIGFALDRARSARMPRRPAWPTTGGWCQSASLR